MNDDKPKKAPVKRERWKVILLVTLRWTWIPMACAAALLLGLTIGYVILGGQQFSEVFSLSTWRHLFDLIFA